MPKTPLVGGGLIALPNLNQYPIIRITICGGAWLCAHRRQEFWCLKATIITGSLRYVYGLRQWDVGSWYFEEVAFLHRCQSVYTLTTPALW